MNKKIFCIAVIIVWSAGLQLIAKHPPWLQTTDEGVISINEVTSSIYHFEEKLRMPFKERQSGLEDFLNFTLSWQSDNQSSTNRQVSTEKQPIRIEKNAVKVPSNEASLDSGNLKKMNVLLEQKVISFFENVLNDYYSPKTGMLYTRKLSELPGASFYKTEEYKKGNYNVKPYKEGDEKILGYNIHGGGTGTEDSSMFGGIVMVALCDWYKVTKNEKVKEYAAKIFKGLVTAATVHGEKGFIARGVCHEDGSSIFPGSSRDQYTHSIHGMWHYFHSDMSSDRDKDQIRKILKDVSDKMEKEVVEENNFSFDFAYGIKDDRGVAKMRNVRPPGAARLAMFYAATWDVTKENKYLELYKSLLSEALKETKKMPQMTDEQIRNLPAYVVLQVEASLEVLLNVETSLKNKQEITDTMKTVTEFVSKHKRFSLEDKKPRDAAEILGGMLMCPDFELTKNNEEILRATIFKIGGWIGSGYPIIGAYWRARLEGYLKP